MTTSVNRQASIDSRRISLEREIAIRVPRFDSFVTEYSSNISTTGMFIISEKPQAPGTNFSFEFSVADDWKLIRGKGQVVWTRYRDEGPDRPPGMGIKFLELDAQSRRLIRWIVEKHIREGGKPFELDELRSAIDQALEQVLDADDPDRAGGQPKTAKAAGGSVLAARTTEPRRRDRSGAASERRALPLLATAAVVLALVGALFWLTEWFPGSGPERGTTTAAAVLVDSETAASGAATEETVAPEPEPAGAAIREPAASAARPEASQPTRANSSPPPVGSAYRSVSDTVAKWADAWSAQDVDRYLAHYSKAFDPEGGLGRSQWAAMRRDRIRGPEYIKVSITGLQIDRVDDEHAQAAFNQIYRSDRFSDMVRKTLVLVWEDGTWKIQSERTGAS